MSETKQITHFKNTVRPPKPASHLVWYSTEEGITDQRWRKVNMLHLAGEGCWCPMLCCLKGLPRPTQMALYVLTWEPHSMFPRQREGISGYLLKPVWVNRASQVTCRKRAGGWDPAGSCESGMAPSYRGFVLVKIGSYFILSLWVVSAAPLMMPLLGLTRCRCRNGS